MMEYVPVAVPVANPNPAFKLAQATVDRLSTFSVTLTALEDANRAVYLRRVARGKALNAKNPEYVIETLLRPVVNDCAVSHLAIHGDDDVVSRRIYSGHSHTTDDDENVYERRWGPSSTSIQSSIPTT